MEHPGFQGRGKCEEGSVQRRRCGEGSNRIVTGIILVIITIKHKIKYITKASMCNSVSSFVSQFIEIIS